MLFRTTVAIDRGAAPYSFNSLPSFLDQALGKHPAHRRFTVFGLI
jgi:hypothetical protein